MEEERRNLQESIETSGKDKQFGCWYCDHCIYDIGVKKHMCSLKKIVINNPNFPTTCEDIEHKIFGYKKRV